MSLILDIYNPPSNKPGSSRFGVPNFLLSTEYPNFQATIATPFRQPLLVHHHQVNIAFNTHIINRKNQEFPNDLAMVASVYFWRHIFEILQVERSYRL